MAIGRAIVRQPKVFLFDEPLSNLDAELRVQMRLELARLHKQIGATMIYVTHDQVEAMTLADKIFVLQSGVVRQAGRPLELYDDPDNRFVAGFIGSPSHELPRPARWSAQTETGVDDRARRRRTATLVTRRLRGARPATGTRVTLGMRPEHLEIAPDGAEGLPLTVDMEEDLGGVSYLHARTPAGQPIVLERRGSRENFEGRRITATAPADQALVFDESGRARALTGNQTLKTEEDTALKHFLKAAAAATALLVGSAVSPRPRQEVIWWDFLGGGDGVRMKALIDDFNARAPRHPDRPRRPSTGACRSTPRSAPRPRVGQGPDVMTYHLSRVPIALDEGVLSPITDEDLANAGLRKEDFFPALDRGGELERRHTLRHPVRRPRGRPLLQQGPARGHALPRRRRQADRHREPRRLRRRRCRR